MGMLYSLRSAGLFFVLAAFMTGCSFRQTVPTARLIQHQALVDVSGLKESETLETVKVHVSSPHKWEDARVRQGSLFNDAMWRSPSKLTAVGVAYVRLPIPLPAKALVWLAKKEYSKRTADEGQVLAEWTDELGRPWFEARNLKYHVRGYAVTRGFEAWIIYTGYKREQPPSAAELGIAARAMETIVPTPLAAELPQRPVARAHSTDSSTSN
jgi:hypothetical protein